MTFDFYGENIFRIFQDNNGGIIRDPEAKPEAQILVDNPRKPIAPLTVKEDGNIISISTKDIKLELDKNTSLLKVTNLKTNTVALEEVKPVVFEKGKTILTLKENPCAPGHSSERERIRRLRGRLWVSPKVSRERV